MEIHEEKFKAAFCSLLDPSTIGYRDIRIKTRQLITDICLFSGEMYSTLLDSTNNMASTTIISIQIPRLIATLKAFLDTFDVKMGDVYVLDAHGTQTALELAKELMECGTEINGHFDMCAFTHLDMFSVRGIVDLVSKTMVLRSALLLEASNVAAKKKKTDNGTKSNKKPVRSKTIIVPIVPRRPTPSSLSTSSSSLARMPVPSTTTILLGESGELSFWNRLHRRQPQP